LDLGRGAKRSFWQKVKDVALTDVGTIVRGIDEEAIDELERLLIESDFGVDASLELAGKMERAARRGEVSTGDELRARLRAEILEILDEVSAGVPADGELRWAERGPTVVLAVGVNGTGKTTTVAKLAHRHRARAGEVTLAAADTFRAGAQDQLRAWTERVDARFVGGAEGADPASVAYEAVESAREGGGLVLVDTAGRLHTRGDLMEELAKIDRVVGGRVEGAPHERLLVVDATSGQNVLHQAREFGRVLELTGLVLTKFDSTARGGTAVAVARESRLPVRYLGTGETLDDLVPFDAERYADGILAGA